MWRSRLARLLAFKALGSGYLKSFFASIASRPEMNFGLTVESLLK
ncbi:hypothetical protein NIES2104_19180 [Leptolyngbya sp. NIES-2104]|nr:hypothetical protein NIES2104_19180 [Leptolyngbya sp. NIES-2104]